MSSDYKGPMRSGLWWSSPDSWQVRFERHVERLHRLQAESHRVDLAYQSVWQQWYQTPLDTKKADYLQKQISKLRARLSMLLDQIRAERTEIRAIEDGYHEP